MPDTTVVFDNCTGSVTEQSGQGDSLGGLTAKLISVGEASKISGLTPGHIRKLLQSGAVEGVKIGRDWTTTEAAIREYMKQDRRPGPKAKGRKH